MKRTTSSRTVAGVLAGMVAGLIAVSPNAAFAAPGSTTPASVSGSSQPSNPLCTPTIFTQAQQRVETALSGRVTQLNALLSVLNDTSNHLTSADRQMLQNDISNVELPGIEGLQPQVQQATTCAQLRVAAHSMVFTYRVYMVMTPQTHLAIVADREVYIEGLFVNLEPAIASAIQNAQTHGKDVTAAEAAYNDVQSQVTAAQNATSGLAAQVLAQTPQGAPGNWQVFLAARTSVSNAHNDLHTAYTDAMQVKADLT
jgi:hypothetical protein